jgi:hypothetical protein
MIGFDGRLRWRQHKLFKLRAKLLRRKNRLDGKRLALRAIKRPQRSPHPKFAVRSNVVRRTIIVQTLEWREVEGLAHPPGGHQKQQ